MIDTLDTNLSFLSYAIVAEKYDSGENIIYSFLPLVEKTLLDIEEETISKMNLLDLYRNKYGYEIPPAILDLLLKQLKTLGKIEFLKNEQIEIKRKNLNDVSFDYGRNTRIFQSSFKEFAKNSFNVDIPVEDTIKVIANFILCNALNMNSYIMAIGNFSDLTLEDTDNSDYFNIVSEYLLKIRNENPTLYSLVEDIYYGVILASLLKIEADNIVDSSSENELVDAVLLDCNYIFRLLDLQTKYEHQTTKATHNMLRDANVKMFVLGDTIEQFVFTLRRFLKCYSYSNRKFFNSNNSEVFSGICAAMIRRDLKPSEVEELISSLEDILKTHGIELWTGQVYDKELISNRTIESLLAKKSRDNVDGVIHDIIFIKTIEINRKKPCLAMKDARIWALTDDLKLCKWCLQNKDSNIITPCITEAQINTLFWLKKRNKIDKNGLLNSVLAFRNQRLLDFEQYTRIVNAIEIQKERFKNNPKKLETLSLIFTESCLSLEDVSEYSENRKKLDETIDNGMNSMSQKMNELSQKFESQKTMIEELSEELNNSKTISNERLGKVKEYEEEKSNTQKLLLDTRINKINELEAEEKSVQESIEKKKKWSQNLSVVFQIFLYGIFVFLGVLALSNHFSWIIQMLDRYNDLLILLIDLLASFGIATLIRKIIPLKIRKIFNSISDYIFKIKKLETEKDNIHKLIEENNKMIEDILDAYKESALK